MRIRNSRSAIPGHCRISFVHRFVAGACVLLAVAACLAFPRVIGKMPDLEVYWKAAVRARAAEALYRVEDQHYQFKYAPAFAVLAIPIGLVPLAAAKSIWYPASVALVLALVWLSVRLLPERRRPGWLLVLIVTAAMAKFYGHEIVLGQVNALFAVIVLLALASLRTGGEVRAGLLLALAVVVKPYAAIFVPWLLARRRAGSVAACLAGLLFVLALPAALYGIPGDVELHRGWWKTVTESTAPNLANADNVSIAGMYAKWLGPGSSSRTLTVATAGAVLAVVGFVFIRRRALPFPEALEGALLLTAIPLLSPQGWDYVFLISTPAIAFIVNYEDRLPRVLRVLAIVAIAVVGLSVFDLMGRRLYAAFMATSALTVCFFVIAAALTALRARKIA